MYTYIYNVTTTLIKILNISSIEQAHSKSIFSSKCHQYSELLPKDKFSLFLEFIYMKSFSMYSFTSNLFHSTLYLRLIYDVARNSSSCLFIAM